MKSSSVTRSVQTERSKEEKQNDAVAQKDKQIESLLNKIKLMDKKKET